MRAVRAQYDYGQVLGYSYQFYDAERLGQVPPEAFGSILCIHVLWMVAMLSIPASSKLQQAGSLVLCVLLSFISGTNGCKSVPKLCLDRKVYQS